MDGVFCEITLGSDGKLLWPMTLSDKLLNRLAHDIRGAVGVVAMANSEIFGEASPEVARHRAMVDRGLARLTRIAELLSSVGHAGQEGIKLELVPAPIGPMIERAHARALAINPKKQISFELPDATSGALVVPIDERWIGAALTELEINAIKFAKSKVKISVAKKDQRLEITISDDGPGFASDPALDPPWGKGFEADSIGLGLAKAAMDAHGGSLSVVRPSEGGAQVSLQLSGAR
jgi:two-component system, sensor histidine kinase RegB